MHTWPAYRDAMEYLVAGTEWRRLTKAVSDTGTSVEFVWGDADRIGDPEYARTFADATVRIVPGSGHHLPLSHGNTLASHLSELTH